MVRYPNMISEFDKDDNSKNKRKHFNSQLQASIPESNPLLCSICKSNQKIITDTESGEIICSNCGQVISDKIQQTGPEWRNFASSSSSDESNDRRSRIGILS